MPSLKNLFNKEKRMNALVQYATLELMLMSKSNISIKDAINAIDSVEKMTQKRATLISFLTLKYQVKLHIRKAS